VKQIEVMILSAALMICYENYCLKNGFYENAFIKGGDKPPAEDPGRPVKVGPVVNQSGQNKKECCK